MLLTTSTEVYEWRRLRFSYEFLVDLAGGPGEMNVNVDMTVAMECKYLRIDAQDAVGASLGIDKKLRSKAVTYHIDGVEDSSQYACGC
ncbi:hypothetical protein HDU91_006291 [Kappamyces sp. JEL0680]|nr:hypothetical protein HDU91_006291 [Kappamyces sp. JEL0680]